MIIWAVKGRIWVAVSGAKLEGVREECGGGGGEVSPALFRKLE